MYSIMKQYVNKYISTKRLSEYHVCISNVTFFVWNIDYRLNFSWWNFSLTFLIFLSFFMIIILQRKICDCQEKERKKKLISLSDYDPKWSVINRRWNEAENNSFIQRFYSFKLLKSRRCCHRKRQTNFLYGSFSIFIKLS